MARRHAAAARRRARPDRHRDPGAQGRAWPSPVARGGQDPARGRRRGRPGGADLQVLRGPGAGVGGRAGALGPARHHGRGHPRAHGRGRPDHALELPDRHPGLEDRAGARLRQLRGLQARRPRARLGLGAGGDHQPRRAAGGRVQPGHGPRLGRGRSAPGFAGRGRDQLHGLRRHRPRHRRQVCRRDEEVPARDGRQEPAGRAGRRRPQDRRRLRRPGGLLLDRPALHRELAPDRRQGHPRPVRGRGHRRAQGAGRRRRAQARHADRPGGRPEAARPGPALCRARSAGAGETRLGRRAAEPRDAGLLPAAGPVHRDEQRRCGSTARRSSGRWRR